MATIRKEFRVSRAPDAVWDALRDFSAVHQRLAHGFVTSTQIESQGVRIVTFANGTSVRERLVTSDDAERRLVYAINDSPAYTHYSATAQVFEDETGSRFLWTVDFLPDSMAGAQNAAMDAGAEAMRTTLNKGP